MHRGPLCRSANVRSQTTTTEATNADVCESVFRVITAKVFPSSRFRLKRCDHLHLEEDGVGERSLQKGKEGKYGRRALWEKGGAL